jgi:zinc transporter 1
MTQIDGVLAVHEFHVWQLAGDRIIASAHIRCHNLHDYMQIAEKVKEFFHNEGIHSTTIQPEFIDLENENEVSFCLMVIVVSLLPELMRLLSSAMERNHYDDTASCLLYP